MRCFYLILFFSLSVAAEVCNVDIFIQKPPASKVYQDEVNEKASKCKSRDVLSMEFGFANEAPSVAKHLLFEAISNYCDFSKSIEYDLSGLNFNLVCAFKKNTK